MNSHNDLFKMLQQQWQFDKPQLPQNSQANRTVNSAEQPLIQFNNSEVISLPNHDEIPKWEEIQNDGSTPISLDNLFLRQSHKFDGDVRHFIQILKNYKVKVNIINSDIIEKLEEITGLVSDMVTDSSVRHIKTPRNPNMVSEPVKISSGNNKQPVKTAVNILFVSQVKNPVPFSLVECAGTSTASNDDRAPDSVKELEVKERSSGNNNTQPVKLTVSTPFDFQEKIPVYPFSLVECTDTSTTSNDRASGSVKKLKVKKRSSDLSYKSFIQEAQIIMSDSVSHLLKQHINNVLENIIERARVSKIGSIAYGLCNTTSSYDFCIVGEPAFDKKLRELYNRVGKEFKNKHSFTLVKYISDPNPRATHIIVHHKQTDKYCKIFMGCSAMFLQQTSLIKNIFSGEPLVRSLGAVIKQWTMTVPKLKTISTYELMLLIIFYLQSRDILPPIDKLNSNRLTPVQTGGYFITDWKSVNIGTQKCSISKQIIFEHFMGFLRFYLKFNYSKMVICPLVGKPVPKTCLFKCENMGDGLKRLADYRYRHDVRIENRTNELLQMAMVIQCPVDLLSLFGYTAEMLDTFLAVCSVKLKSMNAQVNA